MSNSLWPHRLQTPSLLCLWGFSRQENWSRLPCSPPENLSNTGIRPRSPTLQEDSLPSEPPRNQVYSKCTSRKSYPDSNEIQVIQVQIHSEYTSRKAYPGDKILHSKVIVKCCELIQEVTWLLCIQITDSGRKSDRLLSCLARKLDLAVYFTKWSRDLRNLTV